MKDFWFNIKQILIAQIKSNYSLSVLFQKIRTFFNRYKKNSKCSVFLSKGDLKNYKINQVSRVIDNNLYGLDLTLKYFIQELNCSYIEHGLFIGSFVHPDVFLLPRIRQVITFGKFREMQLRESGWQGDVITTGPYILHCKSLYDSKGIERERAINGKTLLFFPVHNVSGTMKIYDKEKLSEKLHEFYPDVKTIIVCLYYIDYLHGEDEFYRNKGYIVTSAGNKFDKNFLPRLKALIKISDYTASNEIGTIVGYCLAIKKPFQHINAGSIVEIAINKAGELERKSGHRTCNPIFEKIRKEYTQIFSERKEHITREQQVFFETYFC